MWKWLSTPEAKKIATSAQEKAWKALQRQFPRTDRSKFEIQANFTKNHTATAEVFFKGSGVSTSVFGSDRRYWSPQMETALGLDDVNGFPYQLSPLKTKKIIANPGGEFHRTSTKHKENLCQLGKNLRHTRLFLLGEIQTNIRANKAGTQLRDRIKSLVRRA